MEVRKYVWRGTSSLPRGSHPFRIRGSITRTSRIAEFLLLHFFPPLVYEEEMEERGLSGREIGSDYCRQDVSDVDSRNSRINTAPEFIERS
jgi:hypothetical protein